MATIAVETDAGKFALELAIGDIRRFEREYKITLADLEVPEGQSAPAGHLDKMLYLAWCAAKRLKHTELGFDDWCDTITNLGAVVPDPLDQPTTGSPNLSPSESPRLMSTG